MLEKYKKRMALQGQYMGEALKKQSDDIMNATFTNDIQFRKVKINDEYIDAKYITYTYYSISGDNVDYHLQFRPGVHYPIGTYVDVPDDVNEYHRWLIVGRSDEPQFVKYNILKCNWLFKWMDGNVIRECLGVLRKRSSYNSGVWNDFKFTTPENQEQIILPSGDISRTLKYNTRLLISENQINPIAWQVTKIEDVTMPGITYFTLKQDLYDPNRDNAELMIADYYESNIAPNTPETPDESSVHISFSSKPEVKVGGSYKQFTVPEQVDTIWTWRVIGLDEIGYQTIYEPAKSHVFKIKMPEDYSLVGTVFTIEVYKDEQLVASQKVEVTAL